MDNQLYELTLRKIEKMKNIKRESVNRNFKQIDFELLERVLNRLRMFSNTCSFCMEAIPQIITLIDTIYSNHNQLDTNHMKEYKEKLNVITNHMEKDHKLFRKDHFVETYIPIGMCFGVTFGIVFNNILIGISIGLLLGVAIGNQQDADAKKKGRTI